MLVWVKEAGEIEFIMKQAAESGMLGEGNPFAGMPTISDLQDVNTIAARLEKAEGVEVLEKKSLDDKAKGVRGGIVKVKFKSLEHLARSNALFTTTVSLKQQADKSWRLRTQRVPEKAATQFGPMLPQAAVMAAQQLKNWRVKSTWTLPDWISKTSGRLVNAVAVTGEEAGVGKPPAPRSKTTTWLVNIDGLAAPGTGFKPLDRDVQFGGAGLSLKPFDVSMRPAQVAQATPTAPAREEGAAPETEPEGPAKTPETAPAGSGS